MILAIRITGLVGMDADVEETLFRMRLRKKYAAVLIKPTAENLKLIQHVRNFIAFGDINHETLVELIKKRAIPLVKDAKLDAVKIAQSLETRKPEELGIKPFFRLHPPRGGIESKVHAGIRKKAVLGDNKEKINDLVRRML